MVHQDHHSNSPTDSDEDTDSSTDNWDVVNSTKRKGGGKIENGTFEDLGENSSTKRVKKAKTITEKGEIQLDKMEKGVNSEVGTLLLGKYRASKDM